MTRVKVSGITTAQDAEAAVAAGVDMLACVFYARSPRYVTLERACTIRRVVPAGVALVGVFVDTPLPLVQRVRQHCALDLVQLFGQETREEVEACGHAFKALTVGTPSELEDAARTHMPRKPGKDGPSLLLHLSGDVAGGWHLAAGPARRGGLILAAASLASSTVGQAISAAGPWAVDVWDAVETEPGRLDAAALAEFVAQVRAADGR